MGAYIDRTGKVFGYLTILNRAAKKSGQKILWDCQCKCGNKIQKRSDSLNSESMCRNCANLYAKGALLSPSGQIHPQIPNEIGNTYNKLTVIELDYEANKEKINKGVLWKCRCECGNMKTVNAKDLRNGAVSSCGCSHVTIEQPGTIYNQLTIIKRIENSITGKARYLCQCSCGNTCEVVGSDLRSQQQISCGCIKSKGETSIIKILTENNINYIKEVKFSNCKDKKELPFDFQIFINDKDFYLIEYDGKQHFTASHSWDNFSFEQTQKHDEIKNQWCKENNIPLIRIPYTHYKNLCIEDLLLETSTFII